MIGTPPELKYLRADASYSAQASAAIRAARGLKTRSRSVAGPRSVPGAQVSAVRRGGGGWLGDCVRDAEVGVLRTQAAVASRQRSRRARTCAHADISCAAVPGLRTQGILSDQDQTGIAAAPGGLSALSAFGLGLEPFRKDDGSAGRRAPAQGPEEVFGPDQAALVDLVLRIPSQELDPGPEAGLLVAPGPGRVVRIVNALAADLAAVDTRAQPSSITSRTRQSSSVSPGSTPPPSRFQYRSPSPLQAPRTIIPASVKQIPYA